MSHFNHTYLVEVPNSIKYTENPMRNKGRKNTTNNLSNLNLSNVERQILQNTNIPLQNRRKLIRNRRNKLNTRKNKKRLASLMTYRTPRT